MLSWCGCWLMLLLGSSGPTVGQVAVGGAVAGAGRSSSPLAGGPRLGRGTTGQDTGGDGGRSQSQRYTRYHHSYPLSW